MLAGGQGPHAAEEIVLHRDSSGRLNGTVYYGSQLVIAAADYRAVDAFAVDARRHPTLRSFVGPKAAVDRLWAQVRSWHRPPALVRSRQPLYLLTPQSLVRQQAVDVRQATLADAEWVIEHSAQMMLGELGYDPRANRTTFAAGIRRAIGLGQWWVWVAGDELRFQINVGARTAATAQLQGVWVPPALRKHGYARSALGAVAERLLREHPTLSLYVNDFNADAIALYERAGFRPVGEMSTLLFA